MKIVESWEDQKANVYAIVQHSPRDKRKYGIKEYEALWMIDDELNSFGGSVGYGVADFDRVEEAEHFLLTGMSRHETDTDIWLRMAQVA